MLLFAGQALHEDRLVRILLDPIEGLGADRLLVRDVAERVAVDERTGERGEVAHRVFDLREAAGADIDDFGERQLAILRGVEPEHRVVAQARHHRSRIASTIMVIGVRRFGSP